MTLLQQLMVERRLTRKDTLKRLRARAASIRVDDFALGLRQLDRMLAGDVQTRPRPSTCRVIEAEFNRSIDELLSRSAQAARSSTELAHRMGPGVNASDDDVRALVSAAAKGSSRLATWVDGARIDGLTLASLHGRLAQLATDYVHSPLVPVFIDLIDLRDDLFALASGRPDPARLRDVYLLAGTTCAMLSHASGDLGHPNAAAVHASAALACADRAGHPTLTAWVLATMALTCEWFGQVRESLQLAAQARNHGQRAQAPGTVMVWATAIEARANARLGDAEAARAALRGGVELRQELGGYSGERDEFDQIGGILTFTTAKQHFYSGSTYLRIGDASMAEVSSSAAIDGYGSGPTEQRSYGDETLAWVDVATARLRGRADLEGSVEALNAVASMPSSLHLPVLAHPLLELRGELGSQARFHRCADAANCAMSSVDCWSPVAST